MARYTGPKNRIARRFGVNIFGRARNPLLHKATPPGMHGAKRRKKSDFGLQLEEKQKLRAIYGMLTQKQLAKTYQDALSKKGNTAEIFLQMLECRLDNLVYRLRFAPTIFAAQQLVAHGHILVNGKKVDIRSFRVRPGMAIALKPASQKLKAVEAAISNTGKEVPEYLALDENKTSGTLSSLPALDQIPLPIVINIPLICEFLARAS
ncbi:MAG: 30S ribosomal protein S4 [Parachlamydiales bacterium]|jgi:small subunit ribosomal protein S4